jgi:hypothetical protein
MGKCSRLSNLAKNFVVYVLEFEVDGASLTPGRRMIGRG